MADDDTFLGRARKLREERGTSGPASDPFDAPYRTGRGEGYAQTALDAEVNRVRGATTGSRNQTLNRAAFSLGQLVAGCELDEQDVIDALTLAAYAVGLDDREIGPTVRSGLAGGARHPRTAPAPRSGAGSAAPVSPAADDSPRPVVLDDDFWAARAHLKHIRDAAHARQRSAPAVLGVVLARVAAFASHQLRIPPIVGGDAGLSLIVAVLAPPGVGKSSASQIGSSLLLPPERLDVADQLPIGTGEGLAEVFFGMVEEPDENGKARKVKKQIRANAFFYIDEGQVLGEIGTRRNATLLPTIRSAFSGATLGQMNASEERRRILPAGSYTLGMVVALQVKLAGALLDDADGGTPQRMLWLPAIDSTIPDDALPWPGRLPWHPPTLAAMRLLRQDDWVIGEKTHLQVAETVSREIREADLARARGEAVTAALDAHEGLLRLKVAALLAILDGRLDISEEDWQLATTLKQASDITRGAVEAAVQQEAARREEEQSSRLARRAAHADATVAERRVFECARKIAKRVWTEPDRAWTRRELRGCLSAQLRSEVDEGLDFAAAEGWLAISNEPGQGTSQRSVRCGSKRPS